MSELKTPHFPPRRHLLDVGDTAGLRDHLKQHPSLVRQHVTFEGGNYFGNPTLLEFVAENPIRHGTLISQPFSGFPAHGRHQHPRVRLSLRKAA